MVVETLEKSVQKKEEVPARKEEAVEQMSEADIDKMIQYAKNTARPLELSYWEARKSELQKKQGAESETEEMTMAEIDKMVEYTRDTGRLLELSYWQLRKKEFGKKRKIKQKPEQIQEQVQPEKEPIREKKVETPPVIREEIKVVEEKKPEPEKITEEVAEIKTKAEERVESEIKPEIEPKVEIEEEPPLEPAVEFKAEEQPPLTIEQKDTVDQILERGDDPAELVPELVRKEQVDERVIDNSVDEAVAVLEKKETTPKDKTILQRMREVARRKATIYVGAGLLTLMAWKIEAYEHISKAPSTAVRVFDKIPDVRTPVDFTKMVASEAARYSAGPYLTARYIGSNDYFGLEAIKAADAVGLEGTAENMYEESLNDYVNNFPETRRANRFTTLDKHTVRNYIDTFVKIYTGNEESKSGVETYKNLEVFWKKTLERRRHTNSL